MNQFIAALHIKPIIDQSFPLAQNNEAFRYSVEGRHFGKAIINFNQEYEM